MFRPAHARPRLASLPAAVFCLLTALAAQREAAEGAAQVPSGSPTAIPVQGGYLPFGRGCPGSGRLPDCGAHNRGGGVLHTRPLPNEYAYAVVAAQPMTVTGFRLFTRSATPSSGTTATALYRGSGGRPAADPVATGTLKAGPAPAFYRSALQPPVRVDAGEVFWIAQARSDMVLASSLQRGQRPPGVTFWRRGGAWRPTGIVEFPAWTIECAGGGPPNATPELSAAGQPALGAALTLNLDGARASSPAVLLLAASRTWLGPGRLPIDLSAAGAPGCLILTSGDIGLPALTDARGSAAVRLAIPNAAELAGAAFFNQYAIPDPGANRLGLVFSNGGQGTIGGDPGPLTPVPAARAVAFNRTPPGVYGRLDLHPGQALRVHAQQVLITPPVDAVDPYVYGRDFELFRVPGRDEFVARFDDPGGYTLLGLHGGRVTSTTTVSVGSVLKEEKKKQTTGEYSDFTLHAADLYITDACPTNWDVRSAYGDKVICVTSVKDAVAKICKKLGTGKIKKLVFFNHGMPGQCSAGDGNRRRDGQWFGKDAAGSAIGAFDALAGLKGKITDSICIVACNAGDGKAGQHLVDCLAKKLGIEAQAKKGSVKLVRRDGKWKTQASAKGWAKADAPK